MKFYLVTLVAGILGTVFVKFLQVNFKISLIISFVVYAIIVFVFIMIFFKNFRPKFTLSYKCSFCEKSGTVATISNQPAPFLLSRWYKDDKGFNHEIIVCNSCGCIHDVQFSFFKMLISMFVGSPYKQNSSINLMEFATFISEKAKEYNTNARSVAFYEYGINEVVIDHLLNNRIVGSAFADRLEEQNIYSSKRSDAIAKRINEQYFENVDMSMFGCTVEK